MVVFNNNCLAEIWYVLSVYIDEENFLSRILKYFEFFKITEKSPKNFKYKCFIL